MSLKLLEQRGLPLARPLLRLIATFADAPLPYTLLLTPQTLAGAEELAQLDHTALGSAVQALHSSALAQETGMPEEPDHWDHWALLQPHALDLFHRAAGSEPPDQTITDAAATAANLAVHHLLAKGLYGQARGEVEAVLAHQRASLGDAHPSTLTTRHGLANFRRLRTVD